MNASSNIVICKCRMWNRVPAANYRAVICWNCGNSILPLTGQKSGVVVKGERISSPMPDRPKPRPAKPVHRSRGNGAIPVFSLLILMGSIGLSLLGAIGNSSHVEMHTSPHIRVPAAAGATGTGIAPQTAVVSGSPVYQTPNAVVPTYTGPMPTFSTMPIPQPPPLVTTPIARLAQPIACATTKMENKSRTIVQRSDRRRAIAPLAIETDAEASYLIKLVNVRDDKDQIVIYVRGGDTYSTKIPLGSYRIRVASGQTWCGRDVLFGPNTRYFRLASKDGTSTDDAATYKFTQSGNRIFGMTLQFKSVAEGNMSQEAIKASEF
jgi:hypothetical protein